MQQQHQHLSASYGGIPPIATAQLPLSCSTPSIEVARSTDSSPREAEQYSADFLMFNFKIDPCCIATSHASETCPYAHQNEKARRRSPLHFSYIPVPCPDYRKGVCKRGDICPWAHGVFEAWLHPLKFRTLLCKDGQACMRRVCFFAHSTEELRAPPPLFEGIGNCNSKAVVPPEAPARQSLGLPSVPEATIQSLLQEYLASQGGTTLASMPLSGALQSPPWSGIAHSTHLTAGDGGALAAAIASSTPFTAVDQFSPSPLLGARSCSSSAISPLSWQAPSSAMTVASLSRALSEMSDGTPGADSTSRLWLPGSGMNKGCLPPDLAFSMTGQLPLGRCSSNAACQSRLPEPVTPSMSAALFQQLAASTPRRRPEARQWNV